MVMVMIGLQFSLASSLWAFAVGDIAVHSRRGEPFAAEVRLLLEPRERDKEVEVTLGNQETYRTEGLRRAAVIDTLKAVVPSGARDVIRLSSGVPLQESAFDLVLSVRAGQVTIVKHYFVTLPAPAAASAQVLVPLPTIAPVAPLEVAKAMPVMQAPKATARPTRPSRRTERYGPVERGETLYSIARGLQVSNDKLWQAVVVLWRANKGQFSGGNPHGLQVGSFLEIPSDFAENIAALRLAEAQEIIAHQWEEWQTLQRLGPGKQRVIAARDTEANATAPTKRETSPTAAAKREAATPVAEKTAAEKTAEKPPAPQAVVLPVGKHGNLVSMAELQTVLQGLEERLMRRLTPTAQEVKGSTAFVSSLELQASIQSLEERLTQRMQHMLTPTSTSEPVRVGQRPAPPASQPGPVGEVAQPASVLLVPYVLVLSNVLLLLLVGALLWFWLRRRERTERMQRV
jgi:Tfp pilus assembly protein FimV